MPALEAASGRVSGFAVTPVKMNGSEPILPAEFRRVLLRLIAESSRPRSGADPYGEELARRAISALWGVANGESMLMTSGARSAVVAIATQHRRAVVERPGFTGIRDVLTDMGVRVTTRRWAAMGRTPSDAYLVTTPYRNPDGAIWHGDTVSGHFYCNATYRPYAQVSDVFPSAARTFGSVGKILGAGIDLGWVDTSGFSSPLTKHLRRALGPSAVIQQAAGKFMERLGEDAIEGSKRVAMEAYAEFVCESQLADEQSWSPFRVLSADQDEIELAELLWKEGVQVGRGEDFGLPANQCRISFLGTSRASAGRAGGILKALVQRSGFSITFATQ